MCIVLLLRAGERCFIGDSESHAYEACHRRHLRQVKRGFWL